MINLPGKVQSPFLYDIFLENRITSTCFGCLDVADPTCLASSSAQTWTSNSNISGGVSVAKGLNTGAEAFDPTFTGTFGLMDESVYFNSDGGDFFTAGSRHTETDTWNMPGADGTVLAVVQFTGGPHFIFNLLINGTTRSVYFQIASTGVPVFYHGQVTGPTNEAVTPSSLFVAQSQWTFIAFAFSDSATSVDFVVNGKSETVSMLASVETTPNNNRPMIWNDSLGTGVNVPAANSRYACLGLFTNRLTLTQLNNIYRALKLRRFKSMG